MVPLLFITVKKTGVHKHKHNHKNLTTLSTIFRFTISSCLAQY